MLEGEVAVMTRHGKVLLTKGPGTTVYAGKHPMQAGRWPEDRTKRAVQTISVAETK